MLSNGTRINANVTSLFISVQFCGLYILIEFIWCKVNTIFSIHHIKIPTFIGENPYLTLTNPPITQINQIIFCTSLCGDSIRVSTKIGPHQDDAGLFLCIYVLELLVECKCYVHSTCNCATYHWVVTNAEEAHHLNVSRNRRRTCKLSVRVHTTHGVGHTV